MCNLIQAERVLRDILNLSDISYILEMYDRASEGEAAAREERSDESERSERWGRTATGFYRCEERSDESEAAFLILLFNCVRQVPLRSTGRRIIQEKKYVVMLNLYGDLRQGNGPINWVKIHIAKVYGIKLYEMKVYGFLSKKALKKNHTFW